MINLRYHVYSLVAVFLALAIGVAAGSTVVQRSVVDNLKSTQGRIEKNLDDLEAQNAALQARTDALEGKAGSLRNEGPAALLSGELTDVPIVLIRVQGVSGSALGEVRSTLKVAGAEVVSEIEVKATAADPDALAGIAAELGLGADERQPDQVQAALGERLARMLAAVHDEPAAPTTTVGPSATDTAAPTTEAPPSSTVTELVDYLRLLDDAGLVSVRGPLGDAGVGTEDLEVVVVGGLTKEFDPVPVLRPLLGILADASRPVALAADAALDQPLGDGEEAYGVVPTVRTGGRLRDHISTVDNLGDFAGLTAMALGLAHLADGEVGHYGVDDGADSLLPTRRS